MATIKVRKIGNSMGIILPKESGLQIGDNLSFRKEGKKLIFDTENVEIEHDKKLIEESFRDFSNNNTLHEKDMKRKFSKYGWNTDEL
ncbi:AbrB family transcriptional regulator [Erysipelothrix inopinata]|uniref:AbrB family transcriptional regulator n=1 Tax=Erysipelothrix inopinata TaxID=225084 RepID=A0A7G9RYE4_9FIRM|nr:AbrB family transcriptional regulator [Erysipelothrix inopinata]QNN60619.1 AbrB family transcriptional regulator [Erysipelothrix inopinata]